MGDKLERIFELRVLYARERELSVRLTRAEQTKLLDLKQQLPDRIPAVDDRDTLTVLAEQLPVQYVVSGRLAAGRLRNASAAGLAVGTDDTPPSLGQRVIVYVHDLERSVEYTFPCRVVARVVQLPASMGVRFEGMPSQTRMVRHSGAVPRGEALPAVPTRVRVTDRRERG